MDIKERLKALESISGKSKTSPVSGIETGNPSGKTISEIINGRTVTNMHGSFFYIEKDHPSDYLHGIVALSDFRKRDMSHLGIIGQNSIFNDIPTDRILFIDTETTGLSGGSGTYVFLVGVGYFTADTFRVGQFFMNDYNEEAALLHALNNLMSQFDLIVSYNGRSFDGPLLISRNVYQSMKSPLNAIAHFDLLHVVRRLWKHRLSECSLGYAESMLTGTYREGDIPGYLIPHVYFNYLRSRDARPVMPVLYHNQQDILSMVAILNRALQLIESPGNFCRSAGDIIPVGRMYEKSRKYQEAATLYESFLGDARFSPLLIRLAFTYKKLRNWQKAKAAWQRCISELPFHPLPYIELAKQLEHRDKVFDRATGLVQKALQEMTILDSINHKGHWQEYRERSKETFKKIKRKN